ncbi:MAG: DUF4747 family protein [Chromatiales bacterium]|nr:DUF4747 family protein [Chromatiales bacterium]
MEPRTHILAISKLSIKTKSNRPQMRLMSGSGVINALETLLSPISEERFKNYVLSIHEMTSSESLDDVLNADGYKSIEAKVAFSNSDELIDAIADELESDLKQNNVHDAEIIQRSAKRSEMSGLTKTALAFLALATKHGNAVVRYRKITKTENTKWLTILWKLSPAISQRRRKRLLAKHRDSIFEAIKKRD